MVPALNATLDSLSNREDAIFPEPSKDAQVSLQMGFVRAVGKAFI